MDKKTADLQMLFSAKMGSEEGFTILYECYEILVSRLWQKYYVPDLEFEDWQQEAKMVLVKILALYKGNDINKFSGFYKQSLINRLLDLYRARQADKRIPADRVHQLTESHEAITSNMEKTLDNLAHCHHSMKKLFENSSSFEKEVLRLALSGWTTESISEKLKCTKRQAQSALARSRRKLIRYLSRD
ncbi:sigma-70 family RNA polymerase sigma factor [Lactobacillaceae bacterium 24-114]